MPNLGASFCSQFLPSAVFLPPKYGKFLSCRLSKNSYLDHYNVDVHPFHPLKEFDEMNKIKKLRPTPPEGKFCKANTARWMSFAGSH